MLDIIIPGAELFNESTSEFVTIAPKKITLEHSLVSLSKWESKWKRPFMQEEPKKTVEETNDYIRCMTITQNVDPIIYNFITDENIKQVNAYISDSMTATTFNNYREQKTARKEIITAEVIYYSMTVFNIPFECQKWHLNRLLTLINVCKIKNAPKQKMGRGELMARNKSLNAARKAKYNTKG